MKLPNLIPFMICLLAGLPVSSGSVFGGEAHGGFPRYELAPAAPVARGEPIRPQSSNPVTTNSVASNGATNQPLVVKDGDLVGFDKLSGFPLRLTEDLEYSPNAAVADAKINALIPAAIHELEGRTIRINGYMTPLDYAAGKTTLFILSRNPSGCCFGDQPLIHEMIEVRMKRAGVPARSYVPVQVRGVLHVGAKRNGEALACIYRLDAESVDEAEQ